jgi:squalene synthase HpnC
MPRAAPTPACARRGFTGAGDGTTYDSRRVSVGHYENFPVASLLLPARLRAAVTVVYRFARSADDLADEGDAAPAERLAALAAYRAQLARIGAGEAPEAPLFRDLACVARRHALPLAPFHDLLDAFCQDVTKTRYADFAELLDYCRRSANPIGRLLLHLFGRTEPAACECSDAVCTALQLVNFWQDVALDWRKGRVYLPQDDLRRHGVSERQIAAAECDPAWRSLMREQCERARTLLRSGRPLTALLSGRIAFEIGVTIQGGLRILEKLAQVDYDVFRRRPVLRVPDWPLLAWRAR